jgi:hypothetical protein
MSEVEEMNTNEFGPNTPKVRLFIDRAGNPCREEVREIAARDAAWNAVWDAAQDSARVVARDAAWNAAWDAVWVVARDAARVATSIVVMDLITLEQFTILTEPFAEILTELGIAWEGK